MNKFTDENVLDLINMSMSKKVYDELSGRSNAIAIDLGREITAAQLRQLIGGDIYDLKYVTVVTVGELVDSFAAGLDPEYCEGRFKYIWMDAE